MLNYIIILCLREELRNHIAADALNVVKFKFEVKT